VIYRSRDTKLVESFIEYVNDVKPYHTKVKNFVSELFFNEDIKVSFLGEHLHQDIFFQNIWDKNSIGSLQLSTIAEGVDSDRFFKIPGTVFPRFSSSVHTGQTPPGSDPSIPLTPDTNNNGIPDSTLPWMGDWSYAHQTGLNEIPYFLVFETMFCTILSYSLAGGFYTVHVNLICNASGAYSYYGIPVTTIQCERPGILPLTTFNYWTPTSWTANDVILTIPESIINTMLVTPGNVYNCLQIYVASLAFEPFVTLNTGRYKVPYHQGSQVYVNDVQQTYGVDYVVDNRRDSIQFLAGKHPLTTATININYFNSDKFFISTADPLDAKVSRDYDLTPFDLYPFDSNETDVDTGLLLDSDTFTLRIDTSYPGSFMPIEFYNLTQLSTNKATLENIFIYPSETTGNVWKITAVTFQSVKVQQVLPFVGPVGYAYLNTPFDNGKIRFTLTSNWIPYYFVPDGNSYLTHDLSVYGPELTNRVEDRTNFYVDMSVITEHGVIVDPVPTTHKPVELVSIGKIQQVLIDGTPSYQFVLNDIPKRGKYIELRIEQSLQYNPHTNVTIDEHIDIAII
jgi:hypothetical protein